MYNLYSISYRLSLLSSINNSPRLTVQRARVVSCRVVYRVSCVCVCVYTRSRHLREECSSAFVVFDFLFDRASLGSQVPAKVRQGEITSDPTPGAAPFDRLLRSPDLFRTRSDLEPSPPLSPTPLPRILAARKTGRTIFERFPLCEIITCDHIVHARCRLPF